MVGESVESSVEGAGDETVSPPVGDSGAGEEAPESSVVGAASESRSATRTGGMRIRSPAATRCEASTRRLFTRTSPLRRMR